MKVYLVGGAVRDKLLGLEPKDLDYVVVGSTPEEMLSLGFKQVGKDFPVFLKHGNEYALARRERSTGAGYNDFVCEFGVDVTLEEDLGRRDLTINSIALDGEEIIDPFKGMQDIKDKVIRHTSDAFSEDPVRILRALRFSTTLDFSIHPDTNHLIFTMVKEGALHDVTPERVWTEMHKAFKANNPGDFLWLMADLGIFPEVTELYDTPQSPVHHPEGNVGIHTEMVMNHTLSDPKLVFAAMCHDFGKPVTQAKYGNAHGHEEAGVAVIQEFCAKWKVPNDYRDLAILMSRHHTKVHSCLGRGDNKGLKAKTIMKLFEDTKAITNPSRFLELLVTCEADAKGRGGKFPNQEYPQLLFLWQCLLAVKELDTKSITSSMLELGKSGLSIGEAIRVARIGEIRNVINMH